MVATSTSGTCSPLKYSFKERADFLMMLHGKKDKVSPPKPGKGAKFKASKAKRKAQKKARKANR